MSKTWRRQSLEKWVIGFTADPVGAGVMRLQKRYRAFQVGFTPRRKRWAGVLLILLALIGMVLNPASRWPWVLATGVIWLIAAWLPTRRH